MKIRSQLTLVLLCGAFGVSPSTAQDKPPKEVPTQSIASDAKDVSDAFMLLGVPDEVVIEGDLPYDSYFVGAKKIIFKSGARLIFSDRALKTRNNLIVAAKTIVNEDQSKPGIITWDRGDGPSAAPPQSGQAPGGPHGQGDGESGGPGYAGATGNAGLAGRNAPNLVLFMMSAEGAPPIINFSGQAGGQGGVGQQGGNGGVGRQGSPASSGGFDCKRGVGHGGNGGNGGIGGVGGIGGTGGAGGTVTLVSLPSAFPALLTLVRTDVSGGAGGEGGQGGNPGSGGPGGPQGAKSLPYCKDEPDRRGQDGAAGGLGSKGNQGTPGIQGDVSFTTLTEDAFNRIIHTN